MEPPRDAQKCKGIETGKSMPHTNDCRKRIRARMEENEEGREGLKREEQRQDQHFEKAAMRGADDDPELRRAEEEHKRKLLEIENDDGPRGSEGERDAKKEEPRRPNRSCHGPHGR